MDVGGGGGGDLPGTYTIDEGATRALGTNKRSASERFEAGAQTAKAARIESVWHVTLADQGVSKQVQIGYPDLGSTSSNYRVDYDYVGYEGDSRPYVDDHNLNLACERGRRTARELG